MCGELGMSASFTGGGGGGGGFYGWGDLKGVSKILFGKRVCSSLR
jgi:hypothetical protein